MQIDRSLVPQIENIPWLQECGKVLPAEIPGILKALDEEQALTLFNSAGWADARTEAQGDLTGYLAKHHYNDYGGHWNRMVKEASRIVEDAALQPLRSALRRRGWDESFSGVIVVDLTRAMLERSYRTRFRKAPAFFDVVFAIYKAGHLPCGWSEDISNWPKGAIIAY